MGNIPCPRCGQRKWDLVLKDSKLVEDDGKGKQVRTGTLAALKCHYCSLRVERGNDGELVYLTGGLE